MTTDGAAAVDAGGMPSAFDAFDVLRMSILNALLAIQTYRAAHPAETPATAARVLASGPAALAGFAYATALRVAEGDPTIVAPGDGPRPARLRALVEHLIIRWRPSWAGLIPKGRGFLATYLAPATRQCLEAAGLYDTEPDDQVLACWDRLGAVFRADGDAGRTAVGRQGERLTLQHETARLAAAGRADLVPTWVALDDNSLGYDVRSYEVTPEGVVSRYIEVKATEAMPPRFFLSRAEWDVAEQLARGYVLHVWHLPSGRVTELAVDAVQAHMPADQGSGRWHRVEVTLRGEAAKAVTRVVA